MKMLRILFIAFLLMIVPAGCKTNTEKYEDLNKTYTALSVANDENMQFAADGTAQALDAISDPSIEVQVAKQFNGVVQSLAGIPDPKIRASVAEMVNGMIARDAAQIKKFKEFETSAKANKEKMDELHLKVDKLLDIVIKQSKELEEIKAASFWGKIKRWVIGLFGASLGVFVLYVIIAAGGGGILWVLFLKAIKAFPALAIKLGVASASTLTNVVKGVGTIRQDLKREINASHLDTDARKDAAETLDWMNITLRGAIKDVHDEKAIDAIRQQHDL